jgi:hypothetical protein
VEPKLFFSVTVQTFEKLRFRFLFRFRLLTSYGSGSVSRPKKLQFQFLYFKLFYKEKIGNFSKFIVKCE